YRGKIIIGGQRKKGRFSAFEERIGMLSQDPRTVFSGNTVGEDLKTAAMNRGGEDIEKRISNAARLMEIEDLLDRNPFDLSGGEQQRVAIAIVMLTQPRVLLLDEPTKGMDAAVKAAFGEKLCELRNGGTAILIVTHDTEFCAEFADRVGMMFDGSIVTENATREFFCRNTFYTTAANRIARDVYMNAILTEEVAGLVREDKQRR
ncbi:MAG: ABC transporter ATP-binding protein, partial [Clostridia bacterium]|nr:ABC transporter ATP-binding protein [Clostridia bacterium]